MAASNDYYKLLQISPKADPAIVKAAYYTQLRVMGKHPDLGGSHEEAALINEAYEILSDPERRREYDKEFFKGLVSHASAPLPNPFEPNVSSRKTVRVIFQNRFKLRTKRGEWISAQFRDISLGGGCFRCLGGFKKGATVEVQMSESPKLCPTAKIRWIRTIPQRFGLPLYEGGFEFKKIDEEAFHRYLRLVGLGQLIK